MKKNTVSRLIRSGGALISAGVLLSMSLAGAAGAADLKGYGDRYDRTAYVEGDDGSIGGEGSLDPIATDGSIDGEGSLEPVATDGSSGGGDFDPFDFNSNPVDPSPSDPTDGDDGYGGGGDIPYIVFPDDPEEPTEHPDPSAPTEPVPTPAPTPAPAPQPTPPKPQGESYSITYEMNGGVNYGSSPTRADYNQTFNVANPTRNGYVFLGWIVTGLDSSEHCVDYGITFDTVLNYTYATSFCNLRKTAGTVKFTAVWKIPGTVNGINGLVEDGTSQALVYTSGIPDDAEVDFLMNDNRVSFPMASSAGDYRIEYIISAPGTEKDERGALTVTIARSSVKANLSVSGYNGTYDGNAHGVKVKVTPSGTDVEYSTDDSSGWTRSAPRYTDVTNRRVYVRVVDNTSISAYADVVIKKRDPSINFSTNFPASMNQNTTFSTDYRLDAGSQVYMTSSNTSILNINYNGSNVTLTPGNTTGTAVITVKTEESTNYKGMNQQYSISVIPTKLTGLSLNPSSLSIPVAGVGKLTAVGTPANVPVSNLLFVSSDNTVAAVDAFGNVTGVKPGKAIIGAFSGDVKASAMVEVYSPTVPTVAVALDKNTANLTKGASFTLVPAVAVNDNSLSKTLTWSSSDKSVASVSNGNVKGLKAGVADITAKTVTGNTAVCRVTVTEKEIPAVKAVVIDPTANLFVGDLRQLSLTLFPEGIKDKVTWSTTDNRVVIVNGGMIEGVGVGTAVVKAIATNGAYSSCAVTVFDPNDTSLAADKAQKNTKDRLENDDSGSGMNDGRTSGTNTSTPTASSGIGNNDAAIWKSDNAPAQEDLFAMQTGSQAVAPEAGNITVNKDEKKGVGMGLIVAALIGVGVAATAGIVFIGRRRF